LKSAGSRVSVSVFHVFDRLILAAISSAFMSEPSFGRCRRQVDFDFTPPSGKVETPLLSASCAALGRADRGTGVTPSRDIL